MHLIYRKSTISVEGPIQMIIYKICKMYTKYPKNTLQKLFKNLNSSYVVAQKTDFPGYFQAKKSLDWIFKCWNLGNCWMVSGDSTKCLKLELLKEIQHVCSPELPHILCESLQMALGVSANLWGGQTFSSVCLSLYHQFQTTSPEPCSVAGTE